MKAAHWYIQFVSTRQKTMYRAYIYDDYEGTVPNTWPIRLDCNGNSPFLTDESSDGDMFEQARPSTGRMSICSKMPDGGIISVNDLLPDDNISRHVRLVSVSSVGGVETETIVWSGFMSCESLEQPYRGIPEFIEFNIQSTLQAADSVEIQQSEDFAFATILTHIAYAMRSMEQQTSVTVFDSLYLPERCFDAIKDKLLFSNSYFESNENVSGENIIEEVHSISVKAILGQISQYFGMHIREDGQSIYFTDEKSTVYKRMSAANLYAALLDHTEELQTTDVQAETMDLSELNWSGIDHKKSVEQGTRRVIVAAQLKELNCSLSLTDTPRDSLVGNPEPRQQATWTEVYANTNREYHSHMEHRHHTLKMIFPTDGSTPSLQYMRRNTSYIYQNTFFWAANQVRDNYKDLVVDRRLGTDSGINYYVASYMALWRDGEGNLVPGLMVSGFPLMLYWSYNPIQPLPYNKFTMTEDKFLYKNTTPLIFSANEGYLNLAATIGAWFNVYGHDEEPYRMKVPFGRLNFAIRFGENWATVDSETGETGWSPNFSMLYLDIDEGGSIHSNWSESMNIPKTEGYLFKIHERMTGFVSLYVFPYVDAIHVSNVGSDFTSSFFDVFLSSLDLKYIPIGDGRKNERTENRYVKDVKNGFQGEKEIKVGMATDVNNKLLASTLWNDEYTPCKLLTLDGQQTRPELDMLQRMADYYHRTRNKLELQGCRLPSQVLPIIKAEGINDGKTYLPIAESRDWKADTSTLTCIETPD